MDFCFCTVCCHKNAPLCAELYTPPQPLLSPQAAQVSLMDVLYIRIAIHRQDSVLEHAGKTEEVAGSTAGEVMPFLVDYVCVSFAEKG